MKSLTIFAFSFSIFLGTAVNAKRLAEPIGQVHERSTYQGGWALALMASETAGCPVEAPVKCQETGGTLECCPSGQTCFINSGVQYCCPNENDCHTAIVNFPVCANSSWIMYSFFQTNNLFCCEPGYTASVAVGDGAGYCEPAGVAVPSAQLAVTISQDTVAASSTPPSTTAVSISETTETQVATNSTTTATTNAVSTATTTSVAVTTAIHTSSAPSSQTTATTTTLSTTGNPASGSASGSASSSASASLHTSTSIGASNDPAVMAALVAFVLGAGIVGVIN